ncbi:MAG TPA: hypothetical protein VFM55_25345 [Micromonosporaceae bacterium]|nr:hypothetical protein [Micromonosporaceae bacterium]
MNLCHFDVLHALTIKGMAQPGALALTAGQDQDDVLRELDRLRQDGYAVHLERRGSWRVTPQGRDRHAELLADDTPAPARDRLYPAYDRFLPLNHQFKGLCTRWQVRGGAPNDHTDPGHDAAVIAQLGELHAEAEPVVGDLAGVRDRFARYGERLDRALGRLHAGEVNAFTGVLCDSYHDIWMELHRDLLLSLKLDRAEEEARQASAGVGR